MAKRKGKENMASYTFRIPGDLLGQVRERAGIVPVSAIIRKLLEGWLRGDFNIDYIDRDQDEK